MVIALAAMGSFVLNAAAIEDLQVKVDEAQLIRLSTPSAEIIVGNPSIADVSVQGSKVLVVTGKSFGFTNLIVLNAKGQIILNKKLRVIADNTRVVTLRKGIMRYSLHCTPDCQPSLVVGDDAKYFGDLNKANQTKISAVGAALSGGQSGSQ